MIKKLKYYVLSYSIIFLIGAIIGEVILRYKNIKPLGSDKPAIEVSPGNRYFKTDSILGYHHLAGNFEVTLKKNYQFTTTHNETGLRITAPIDTQQDSLPQIWIMGCSFTHGWSVNDAETYPWLVQKQLPAYKIVNFGMNGLGTIHSLLQLERSLKTGNLPKKIVLAYADFHKERNTFSNARRRAVARWNFLGSLTQPYARLENGKLVIKKADKVEYRSWFLAEQSSLIAFIQAKVDDFKDQKIDNAAITEQLLLRIKKLTDQHKVDLVIANIWMDGEAEIAAFCEKNQITYTDIAVDLSKYGRTNMPYDGHPSAATHQMYADKLGQFLKKEL